MSVLRLAGAPVSWGVDFAGRRGNTPWEAVLDGAARAGYAGLELGPFGYLPTEPDRLAAALAEHGLSLVAGFVFEPLHDPARLSGILELAARTAALVAAAGGRHLVIIDLVSPARAASAGRPDAAPRLDAPRRRALHAAVRAVAAVAGEAGLEGVVHPHAGSFIEFADEIEAVAEVAPLCLDTGHLAFAGLDPVALVARFAGRVGLLHLKDVDAGVRGAVLARGGGFWEAVAAGVFCPLGAGVVDLDGLAAALRAAGYEGWATVEQDRTPGGDPVADLVASRRALEASGVAAPEVRA
jgi:inosose dehydratase